MVELNATLIAQIINFLILVAILAKVAYKPIMEALAAREAKIAGDLAAAEKARTETDELKAQYQQQLAAARTEAQAIVEKARKLAEQTKEDILQEARAENARLLAAAQDEIRRERELALAQLRTEVVTLSLAAAGKIIGRNMDDAANAKLVQEFVDQMDAKKIGGLPC